MQSQCILYALIFPFWFTLESFNQMAKHCLGTAAKYICALRLKMLKNTFSWKWFKQHNSSVVVAQLSVIFLLDADRLFKLFVIVVVVAKHNFKTVSNKTEWGRTTNTKYWGLLWLSCQAGTIKSQNNQHVEEILSYSFSFFSTSTTFFSFWTEISHREAPTETVYLSINGSDLV